jgi:hypothetical protein
MCNFKLPVVSGEKETRDAMEVLLICGLCKSFERPFTNVSGSSFSNVMHHDCIQLFEQKSCNGSYDKVRTPLELVKQIRGKLSIAYC